MVDNLTRKDIIDSLSDRVDYTKSEISQILNSIIDLMIESIMESSTHIKRTDDEETICMEFRGFGTFRIKKMKSRKTSLPGEDELIDIPERVVVRFKPAKSFIDDLQDG